MRRLFLILLILAAAQGPAGGQELDSTVHHWNVETELLIWWLRNGRIPPLLTSGAGQGSLDQAATSVLYGNEKLDVNRHLGGRVTLSYWLDDEQSLGLQVRGFAIERNSRTWETESDGSRVLARPLFDAVTGRPAAEVIAGSAPGLGNLSGAFYGFTKNELFGEQGSVLIPLHRDEGLQLNLLLGGCFLQMRERLELTATSTLQPDEAVILGTTDKWKVYNRFYGGQAGVQGEFLARPLVSRLLRPVCPRPDDSASQCLRRPSDGHPTGA